MLYVANFSPRDILGFATTANGNVPPATAIDGSSGTFIGFDGIGSLYVASSSTTFSIFPTGATGNVAPSSTLTVNTGGYISGISFDKAHDAFVSSTKGSASNPNDFTSRIDIFAPGALGSANPFGTISGSATGLLATGGSAVDKSGTLYITNYNDESKNTGSIEIFANAASTSGNVAPTAVLGGSKTMLQNPVAIAIDSTGRILVADFSVPGILIFAAGATGNVPPVALISGPGTDIYAPTGVTVDGSDDIWVTDSSVNDLLEFASSSSGNDVPMAVVTGAATMLNSPEGVVFVPAADVTQSAKRRFSGTAAARRFR